MSMLPLIAQGTVLRSRYLIEHLLGQGGFSRTYLVQDLERFGERCVLKELVVPSTDPTHLEKARELFKREAGTLYQLHHSQIPRFRASFEEGQRLLLVQDFIAGPTYRTLLKTRKARGQKFTEAEVRDLLIQVLPVLSYLHDRQIIHRDISPENLIWASPSPGSLIQRPMPVLIDFGAVKTVAGYLAATVTSTSKLTGLPQNAYQNAYQGHAMPQSAIKTPLSAFNRAQTQIGKIGYAPPEQLQTGRGYPHSDLYALAVTALVLLTGEEPADLLDSQTLAWKWQPYVHLSPGMASILEKMLAWQPGDRYPSARAVQLDLHQLLGGSATDIPDPSSDLTSEAEWRPSPLAAGSSALGSPPMTAEGLAIPPTQTQTAPQSLLPDPYGALIREAPSSLGLSWLWPRLSLWSAVAAMIVAGWLWGGDYLQRFNVPLWMTQQKLQPPSPSANWPMLSPQTIEFPAGHTSQTLSRELPSPAIQPYQLKALRGQVMAVTLVGDGVFLNVLSPEKQAMNPPAFQVRRWSGYLEQDGEYQIEVQGSGQYTLEVVISPLASLQPPASEGSSVKIIEPADLRQPITGKLVPPQVKRYILKGRREQMMDIRVRSGEIRLKIFAPDGSQIGGNSNVLPHWQGRLAQNGDYVIEVGSRGATDFALTIELF